jgi:hypothetical protein
LWPSPFGYNFSNDDDDSGSRSSISGRPQVQELAGIEAGESSSKFPASYYLLPFNLNVHKIQKLTLK